MAQRRKPNTRSRYRNEAYLKALGEHCARIRKQKGYSMDRMAKESDGLSTSVVSRLEKGDGAITVASLFRYALTLGLHPRDLLDIPLDDVATAGVTLDDAVTKTVRATRSARILPYDDATARKQAFKGYLPVFSLKAAAGSFGSGQVVEPEGWIAVEGLAPTTNTNRGLFVARAVGRSMEPKIHSGDLLLLRAHPGGTRQGKIVLAQYRGPADPETGGSYTVKRYSSTKVMAPDGQWTHKQVLLSPLNPEFEPIAITASDADHVQVIAELVRIL